MSNNNLYIYQEQENSLGIGESSFGSSKDSYIIDDSDNIWQEYYFGYYLDGSSYAGLGGISQPPILPTSGPIGDSIPFLLLVSCVYALFIKKRKKYKKQNL